MLFLFLYLDLHLCRVHGVAVVSAAAARKPDKHILIIYTDIPALCPQMHGLYGCGTWGIFLHSSL